MSFKGLFEKAGIDPDLKVWTKTATLADDESFTLPTGGMGLATVCTSDSAVFGVVAIAKDGTCKLNTGTTVGDLKVADTADKLALYNNSTVPTVKCQIDAGVTVSVLYVYV
jgi:hypothetical protein